MSRVSFELPVLVDTIIPLAPPWFTVIPSRINSVAVTPCPGFNPTMYVRPAVVDLLGRVLRPSLASGVTLESVWISSAMDGHDNNPGSDHHFGLAIDIAGFNGIPVNQYGANADVRALSDAILRGVEKAASDLGVRELLGPGKIFLRNGAPFKPSQKLVRQHGNHIHISAGSDFTWSEINQIMFENMKKRTRPEGTPAPSLRRSDTPAPLVERPGDAWDWWERSLNRLRSYP